MYIHINLNCSWLCHFWHSIHYFFSYRCKHEQRHLLSLLATRLPHNGWQVTTSIKLQSPKQALNNTSINSNRQYIMLGSICCDKICIKSSEAKVQEPHQVTRLCAHVHHVHVCMYACMERERALCLCTHLPCQKLWPVYIMGIDAMGNQIITPVYPKFLYLTNDSRIWSGGVLPA